MFTGVIDLPKYVLEQSVDGNIQFKFTQNIKQCKCCDDLFIRLVKPLQEVPPIDDLEKMVRDKKDFQFISYDGFY